MSKELNSIHGLEEIITSVELKTVAYELQLLHLTSFNGGINRGECIQLTIGDKEGHIQLSEEGVINLMAELTNWLKDKYV